MKYVRFISLFTVCVYLILLVIGLVVSKYGILFVIEHKNPIIALCSISLIMTSYVSYRGIGGLKFVLLLIILMATAFCLALVLANRLEVIGQIYKGINGFTELEDGKWQVQGSIKPGDYLNRIILCKLSDTRVCVEFKYENILIYRPYQLCNIEGKLIYKEIKKIRTYDLYKNTLLQGDDIKIECEDTSISKLFEIREKVVGRIHSLMPRPQSSLLAGIIFGVDQYYSKDFSESIQSAGISHIVAASGYNVSILVLGLEKLTKYLPEKLGYIVKILFIWLYALLTGFSSSMVRASSMASVGYVAKLINLNISIEDIFLITVCIFVLLNPLIAFDLGFLLSVSATFGVIFYVSVLERLIKYKWFPFATVACTLVTLPFTLLNFQTLAPYSIFANLLILPVVESVMLIGLLGLFIPPLIYISWAILKYVEIVATWFGNLPFSIIEIGEFQSIFISILIILLISYTTFKYGSKSSDNIT